MNDNDLMPFGKYIGKRMIDIPGSYFIHLSKEGFISHEGVREYIKENMDVFEEEVRRESNLYESNNKYYDNRN